MLSLGFAEAKASRANSAHTLAFGECVCGREETPGALASAVI